MISDQNHLDIQNRTSYSSDMQKKCLIKKNVGVCIPFHHLKQYFYIFFLLLLLFITFSVSVAETAPFPDSDVTGKQQNTSFSLKPGIWLSGVGDGFRDGTVVLGSSVGAAYGLRFGFGTEEQHDLTLISISYGQMIGNVKGESKWYRGNWELRAELFGGAQVDPKTCALAGLAPHLRYNFAIGTRFVPYVDVGIGVSLTEIREPDLGADFQFNDQASIGVNYFVKDNLSINIAMQYLHISSAGISNPNKGVNTMGCFLGVNRFF